mmetsp:Transcript_85374/g.217600  ORF Transcript_85374/g.217600 Transcript_85374/m.217600 type:complete len:206 (-) Transcript_85374:2-619(-)
MVRDLSSITSFIDAISIRLFSISVSAKAMFWLTMLSSIVRSRDASRRSRMEDRTRPAKLSTRFALAASWAERPLAASSESSTSSSAKLSCVCRTRSRLLPISTSTWRCSARAACWSSASWMLQERSNLTSTSMAGTPRSTALQSSSAPPSRSARPAASDADAYSGGRAVIAIGRPTSPPIGERPSTSTPRARAAEQRALRTSHTA